MPQMRTLVGDQVDLTFQAEFVQARGGPPAYDPGGSDGLE
jgi:hypothetical protein